MLGTMEHLDDAYPVNVMEGRPEGLKGCVCGFGGEDKIQSTYSAGFASKQCILISFATMMDFFS